MSTMAVEDVARASVNQGFWSRNRKVGAGLLLVGLLAAVLFGALATGQDARFTLSEDAAGAAVLINGTYGAILFGLLAAVAGAALLAGAPARWFTPLLGLGIVAALFSFLCWQVSAAPPGQNFMPLVNIVRGTFILALPLIFGALAGVLCERSGVVNVAIEGQLLMGAFAGALVGTMTGNVWAGLFAAALGGALVSLLLAVFTIRYLVDQVVMGIVLNLLVIGLTGFLYERLMQTDIAAYNQPPRFENWEIPILKDIPLLGPALFRGNIFLYLALILVLVIHIGAVPYPMGVADPLGRRTPHRRRHPRRTGARPALPQRTARRAGRRDRWGLVHAGPLHLQQEHDRRQGLHRPRRADLRPVEPHRSAARRALLRLRRPARHLPRRD